MAYPLRDANTHPRIGSYLSAKMKPFLPYAQQYIEDDDISAVVEVLRGDWLTTGPTVNSFEREIGKVVGAPYTIVCSSGTAALHLATLSIGIGKGDTVIVPSLTFLATANAVRLTGAEVVFSDVDPETGLMGAENLSDALSRCKLSNLRAVIPVHLNGQAADMPALSEIARSNGLAIIEDAAHALGTTYFPDHNGAHDIGACRHSDVTAFSFHPVKAIAMGEGGAISSDDAQLIERASRLRNHGIERNASAFESRHQAFSEKGRPNTWYYEMPEIGLNYRASDIHCALGLSQLTKLDRFISHRASLVAYYDTALADLSPLVKPIRRVSYSQTAWHLYVVHIDFSAAGRSRDSIMRTLQDQGIGTQVHYLPVHLQPYYKRRYGPLKLPGAEQYYGKALSLPLHVNMELDDVKRVAEALTMSLRSS